MTDTQASSTPNEPLTTGTPHHYTAEMFIDRLNEMRAIFLDPASRVGGMTADEQKDIAHTLTTAVIALKSETSSAITGQFWEIFYPDGSSRVLCHECTRKELSYKMPTGRTVKVIQVIPPLSRCPMCTL